MTRRFLFFALLPVLPVLLALESGAASLQFSSPNGEAVPMTAPDIEVQLGLEEGVLYGVTVLAVPPASEGVLYSEGVEVAAYDYLSREALESCVFLPLREETATHLALLPNAPGGGYTPVSLIVSDRPMAAMSRTIPADRYAWVLAGRRYYEAVTFPKTFMT